MDQIQNVPYDVILVDLGQARPGNGAVVTAGGQPVTSFTVLQYTGSGVTMSIGASRPQIPVIQTMKFDGSVCAAAKDGIYVQNTSQPGAILLLLVVYGVVAGVGINQ